MGLLFRQEEYRNLIETQRLLAKDINNPGTTPAARANTAKVLVSVIALKREIRMKPKPKPVDVSISRPSKTSTAPMPQE